MITSIAIVKLRASQMTSIKTNNEKLVLLNRIELFASPNRIVFFFWQIAYHYRIVVVTTA